MLNSTVRLQLEQTINHLSLSDLRWLLELVRQRMGDLLSNHTPPTPSLAQLVAKIKATPRNPANIQPALASLAEGLAYSPFQPDPSFEVNHWDEQWDAFEAKMKIDELAHEHVGLKQENWRDHGKNFV